MSTVPSYGAVCFLLRFTCIVSSLWKADDEQSSKGF